MGYILRTRKFPNTTEDTKWYLKVWSSIIVIIRTEHQIALQSQLGKNLSRRKWITYFLYITELPYWMKHWKKFLFTSLEMPFASWMSSKVQERPKYLSDPSNNNLMLDGWTPKASQFCHREKISCCFIFSANSSK